MTLATRVARLSSPYLSSFASGATDCGWHAVVLCGCSVVGEKEQQNATVNIRTRDNKVHGEHSVTHVLQRFKCFTDDKLHDAEEKF